MDIRRHEKWIIEDSTSGYQETRKVDTKRQEWWILKKRLLDTRRHEKWIQEDRTSGYQDF